MGTDKIVKTPHKFLLPDSMIYPDWNIPDFELYFKQRVMDSDIPDGVNYLPILWTSYLKRHSFGNDKVAIQELQKFVDGLDRSKKYFTIVQFDDGTMVDFKDLDIKVFAMAGGRCDYRLPLICQPAAFNRFNRKDIFCSFIGRETHPIRKKIFDVGLQMGGVYDYYITSGRHNPQKYYEILSRSIFGLCPRGYSATSFRIQQCVEMRCIPVYISDEFYIPHGIDFDYGIVIKEEEIPNIDRILKSKSAEWIEATQKRLPTIYASYYAFEGNKNVILNQLRKWD